MFILFKIFFVEYLNTTDVFQRQGSYLMRPAGTYPFQCDKTIPCKDLPHQVLISASLFFGEFNCFTRDMYFF